MKKVIINENQKGFLFHNGRFVKLLGAGKYPLFGAREIEIVSLKEPLISAKCELDTLLANSEVAKLTSVCEVADQQLALHYTSGKFDGVLRRGKYAFWSVLERHEYQLVDISTPEVAEDVPQYIFAKLPTTVYTKVEVAQYQKARLYFDQKLIRILDAGTYYFWKNNKHYLIYDEVMEGMDGAIRNTMKLTPEKLEIKKSGPVSASMVFELDKKTQTHYVTPMGELLVEMTTSRIGFEEEDDHLKVEVEYSLDINYDHVSDCRIVLDVTSKSCAKLELGEN